MPVVTKMDISFFITSTFLISTDGKKQLLNQKPQLTKKQSVTNNQKKFHSKQKSLISFLWHLRTIIFLFELV